MGFIRTEADRPAPTCDERGPFANLPAASTTGPNPRLPQRLPHDRRPHRHPLDPGRVLLRHRADLRAGLERHVLDGAAVRGPPALRGNRPAARVLDAGPRGPDRRGPVARAGRGHPEDVQRLFITAHEVDPKWHVEVQAAFQKHVDNAVSKTVNLPTEATVQDVADIYWMAYRLGARASRSTATAPKPGQVLSLPAETRALTLSQEFSEDCRLCSV